MRSKTILAVVFAAGLVALALVGWRLAARGGAVLRGSGEPLQEEHARDALAGSALAERSGADPSSGPVASAEHSAVPAREPLPSPRTALLRVVRAGSLEPVPGARVWLEREEVERDDPLRRHAMRRLVNLEPALQGGLGREVALDERAMARVPRPQRELFVIAIQGSLHGKASLGPDQLECVIELEAFRSLAWEVVDSSGDPVPGALVTLCWGTFDPFEGTSTWVTDGTGRVSLSKLEELLYPQGYQGELRLVLSGGIEGQPESVTLDMEHLPEDPVRFVVGEHGSVAVQVTDSTGRPLELDGEVFLDIQADLLPHPRWALRAGSTGSMPLVRGRAVFPCVGLDLPLEIGVSAEGYAHVRREVLGPRTPGEVVRVLVPIAERQPRARGRVPAGDASSGLAARAFLNGFPLEGSGHLGAWVEMGAAFEIPFWVADGEPERGVPWALEIQRPGGTLARAVVVPAFVADQAVLDFGKVAFVDSADLIRVRVVDDHGLAVTSASVHVVSASHEYPLWCDEEGRCLVPGEPTELPLRLQAWREEWLPSATVQVDTPGSEITLALRRGARLQGRVLLPPVADPEAFVLRLALEDDTAEWEEWLVEGGRFRFDGCEAGSAHLSILHENLHVLKQSGIDLRCGETTELELDLRETLRPIELSFEIEGGTPWIGGYLALLEPDGSFSMWAQIGHAARVTFLALRPLVDVCVSARGARPRLFENARSGDVLVLPSALLLDLRLPQEIRLPEPPLALVLQAECSQPEDLPCDAWLDVEEAIVGEERAAHLRLPWPGDYELAWVVRNTEIALDFPVEQPEAQTVRVPDQLAPTLTDAVLDPVLVARAVRNAGG